MRRSISKPNPNLEYRSCFSNATITGLGPIPYIKLNDWNETKPFYKTLNEVFEYLNDIYDKAHSRKLRYTKLYEIAFESEDAINVLHFPSGISNVITQKSKCFHCNNPKSNSKKKLF